MSRDESRKSFPQPCRDSLSRLTSLLRRLSRLTSLLREREGASRPAPTNHLTPRHPIVYTCPMSFAAVHAVAAFRHPRGRGAASIATSTTTRTTGTGTTTGGAGCGGETD